MNIYDYLIADSLNLGYVVFNSLSKEELTLQKIANKIIYPRVAQCYIETIDFLSKKFLKDTGEIIFLFDNHDSRDALKELFQPLPPTRSRKDVNTDYKSTRVAQTKEFYNTIDFIKYYFLVGPKKYHTAQITNLEADDLVKPCLEHIGYNSHTLLITNDSDWCRYLSETVQYLPKLYEDPKGLVDFATRYQFIPSEERIILYKILEGDSADNVKMVLPKLPLALRDQVIQDFGSVYEFIFNMGKYEYLREYSTYIKDNEKELRIAYQMLATIPITQEHLKAVLTTGRDSKTTRQSLDSLIFGKKQDRRGFEFGGIKMPRVEPK